MSGDERKSLGRILLEQKALSPAQLEGALARQQKTALPLASQLISEGVVSELDALKALSLQRGVPGIDLNQVCIRLADLNVLPREVAVRHKLLPVLEREDRIFCAMSNPEDKKALEELEFVTGKRIFAYIALEAALLRAIRAAYDRKERGEAFYVGPECPVEIRERMGAPPPAAAPTAPVAPQVAAPPPKPARPGPPPIPPRAPKPVAAPPNEKPATGPQNEKRFRPSSASIPAQPQQVIVDDQMSKMLDAEVNEADFGDIAAELSVVGQMPTEPKPKAPLEKGKKKILVVDDESEIRKLLRRVLEERGYAVVEADRGRAALLMLKGESPDLVILDAMLPEIHGFDIARRIRG